MRRLATFGLVAFAIPTVQHAAQARPRHPDPGRPDDKRFKPPRRGFKSHWRVDNARVKVWDGASADGTGMQKIRFVDVTGEGDVTIKRRKKSKQGSVRLPRQCVEPGAECVIGDRVLCACEDGIYVNGVLVNNTTSDSGRDLIGDITFWDVIASADFSDTVIIQSHMPPLEGLSGWVDGSCGQAWDASNTHDVNMVAQVGSDPWIACSTMIFDYQSTSNFLMKTRVTSTGAYQSNNNVDFYMGTRTSGDMSPADAYTECISGISGYDINIFGLGITKYTCSNTVDPTCIDVAWRGHAGTVTTGVECNIPLSAMNGDWRTAVIFVDVSL